MDLITRRELVRRLGLASAALVAATARGSGASQEQVRHNVTVTSRRYEFSPSRIEVMQDDVLRVTLVAEDIPHSFTIDDYRIAKRAAPGRPVTFEFRADRPGTFTYYCNLSNDEGCRDMRGELVVNAR